MSDKKEVKEVLESTPPVAEHGKFDREALRAHFEERRSELIAGPVSQTLYRLKAAFRQLEAANWKFRWANHDVGLAMDGSPKCLGYKPVVKGGDYAGFPFVDMIEDDSFDPQGLVSRGNKTAADGKLVAEQILTVRPTFIDELIARARKERQEKLLSAEEGPIGQSASKISTTSGGLVNVTSGSLQVGNRETVYKGRS